MLIQSRHVFEVFMGRDSGWKPQRRDSGGTTWQEAWRYHQPPHAVELRDRRDRLVSLAAAARLGVAGACWACFSSVPLSRASGSESLGRALSRFALLRTPEEVEQPALVARRTELIAQAREARRRTGSGTWRAIATRGWRISTATWRGRADPRGHPDPNAFTAQQKLIDARTLDEALEWFTPDRARRGRQRCTPAQSTRAAAGCARAILSSI